MKDLLDGFQFFGVDRRGFRAIRDNADDAVSRDDGQAVQWIESAKHIPLEEGSIGYHDSIRPTAAIAVCWQIWLKSLVLQGNDG